jgi:tetratricopeptide (TPR) repeat protein
MGGGGFCDGVGQKIWRDEWSNLFLSELIQTKQIQMPNEQSTSCANCGKEDGDSGDKLKACAACKLVKHCGRDCQIALRSQHKTACRMRAAELHDEALFRQPPKGDDCPICFLMLPHTYGGQTFMNCCGKIICSGCRHAHELQSSGDPTCPFCRAVQPSVKEFVKRLEKRVDANDASAICQLGTKYFEGDEECGVKKDVNEAIKLYHRAAKLGFASAYKNLAVIYRNGYGTVKDETKSKYYYELAAMAGSPKARGVLGRFDAEAGRFDRAIKHWLIAASCGDDEAVNCIKFTMTMGNATKDHYAQALRGYQQWMNEVRSADRDRAAAYFGVSNHTACD